MNIFRKRLGARRGFTLVELLIVVIIIGILAGMMMLTTGTATDKAEATRIVNNLRNLKTACLMYYADNNAWPPANANGYVNGDKELGEIERYTDRSIDTDAYGKIIIVSDDAGRMWVGFLNSPKLTSANGKGIRDKLTQLAGDAGVYEGTGGSGIARYNGGTSVLMNMK